MNRSHYIKLGRLFAYPTEGYIEDVEVCKNILKTDYPEAWDNFKRFYQYIQNHNIREIEEVFGITFHIQAICFLDLGYVLFGEDYKRGDFLVQMKREQANINHDCGEELPDNLMHVLALMTISKDEDLVQELAVRILIPSLEKMLKEFDESRSALRTKILRKKHKAIIMEDVQQGNIYQNALMALYLVLQEDFKDVSYNDQKIEQSLSNFIPNCGDCSTTNTITKPINK